MTPPIKQKSLKVHTTPAFPSKRKPSPAELDWEEKILDPALQKSPELSLIHI